LDVWGERKWKLFSSSAETGEDEEFDFPLKKKINQFFFFSSTFEKEKQKRRRKEREL